MLRYFALFVCFVSALADTSPNNFCADLNPQPTVIISQLMGMWYGVEIIDHQDQRHFIKSVPSCPIVHLSEDHSVTTSNPLYKNTQYYGYGEGHGYVTNIPNVPKYRRPQSQPQDPYNMDMEQRAEYDRRTTYPNHPSRRLNHGYLNFHSEEHYLRIMWDENGETRNFHARYNDSRKGFWFSSGPEPENGPVIKEPFRHFAGSIQVLKAVGSHMVLTFCHRVPEHEIFSIILSRETKLDPVDIHTIHRMLLRKGLNTNAVKKLCNNSGSTSGFNHWLTLLFVVFLIRDYLSRFVD